MAAGPWVVYNKAKKKIGNATLSLAATTYRMSLHTSASNAATLTHSTWNQVTSEVTQANGYLTGGASLTGENWTATADPTIYRFDVDDVVWTGTGGSIAGIKFAVIYISAATTANRHALCVSQLTSQQFALNQNNTLTIQINSAGVLTLS